MAMGRRRLWVYRAAIAAAIAALWAALWLSRPATTPREPSVAARRVVAGTAPLLSGAESLCPGGTYAGFGSLRLFVPPNYPGNPPSVRLTRCYDSRAEASREGLRSVPVPEGDALVDGIYLVPTDAAVARSCRRAARALGFAVPCPSLLPNPGFGVAPASCGTTGSFIVPTANNRNPPCVVDVGPVYEQQFQPIGHIPGFLLQEGGFAAPPEYGQSFGGSPNAAITVLAARTKVWSRVAEATIGCEGRHVVGTATLAGVPVTIATCRSVFADTIETILRWRRGAVVVSVAAVGQPDQDQRLLEAIAAHLAFVEPS
jgi:hypothetical protein